MEKEGNCPTCGDRTWIGDGCETFSCACPMTLREWAAMMKEKGPESKYIGWDEYDSMYYKNEQGGKVC
mgnify:CR=1 FL=1